MTDFIIVASDAFRSAVEVFWHFVWWPLCLHISDSLQCFNVFSSPC